MQRLGESLYGKKLDRQLVRIVQQTGRELLLLQSSDWPFMMSTRNTPDHAQRRVSFHYANFQQCCSMAERYQTGATIAEEDWNQLAAMEQQDALFGKLDLSGFWHAKQSAFSERIESVSH
jgi:1,4-alpha-glucan branching enzyme